MFKNIGYIEYIHVGKKNLTYVHVTIIKFYKKQIWTVKI